MAPTPSPNSPPPSQSVAVLCCLSIRNQSAIDDASTLGTMESAVMSSR